MPVVVLMHAMTASALVRMSRSCRIIVDVGTAPCWFVFLDFGGTAARLILRRSRGVTACPVPAPMLNPVHALTSPFPWGHSMPSACVGAQFAVP